MICSKCNSEGENGNFCSNCGMQLREKCGECGQMESIGRLVCETKFDEIMKEADEYQNQKNRRVSWLNRWYPLAALFGTIAFTIFCVLHDDLWWIIALKQFYDAMPGDKEVIKLFVFIFAYAVCPSLPMFFFERLERRKNEQSRQEFFENNPDKAEILKKAHSE